MKHLRITKLLIILFLLLAVPSFNVSASELRTGDEIIEIDNDLSTLDVDDNDLETYNKINEELYLHGNEILNSLNPRTRVSIRLSGLNRLVQSDTRWTNEIMYTEGKTIGKAGCCLTSFTMTLNLIYNVSYTPKDVNYVLGNDACPLNWPTAASKYNLKFLTKVRDDSGIDNNRVKSIVIGLIEEYNSVSIIGLKYGNGTHFVVANGYSSNGDIYICDPAASNCNTLQEYINKGYYVYEIYAFTK